MRVLRLKEGSVVKLADGRGTMATARITDASPRKCTALITESIENYSRRRYFLHICMALTKNPERFEWFVEKATEIGIDRITPIVTDRSERKTVKSDRLERIAVSAMKQSQKAYLPVIDPVTAIGDIIAEPFDGIKIIGHCEDDTNKIFIAKEVLPGQNVRMLIGPEGDFSGSEITLALSAGYRPVSLGGSRLRTETAGIYATVVVSTVNEG